MRDESGTTTERRTFLGILLGGVGLLLAGAFSWPIWRFLAPRSGEGELKTVSVPRSDVPPQQAHFFNFHGKPAVVVQPSPGEFAAFSAVCTHLGCVVKWVAEKEEFLCPCHGGRFSAAGKVLGGPPPAPLESLPVELVDDQIQVG